jgi:hypothetical protein
VTPGNGSVGRLPDFLIIGTLKSGSSSVFYWLAEEPGVVLPDEKEPAFFSVEENWRRGVEWYSSLFAGAPSHTLTGEASTGYTDPSRNAAAANRIREVVPDARLVCVLREPTERARSHYRHQVQRGRESRTFPEAAEPSSSYIQRGCYAQCLEPYLELFPREQLCIVRTEDLGDGDGPAWSTILLHLGLPGSDDGRGGQRRRNVTEVKEQFSRPASALFDRGWLRLASSLPKPLRRVGRRVLVRDDDRYRALLASSFDPLPDESAAVLADSRVSLGRLLGPDAPVWP